MAASPWEAAVFDAQGKALQCNAYNLLGPDHVESDLATWLGHEFAGEYLDRYTRRVPAPRLPLYHLVGALDPLTSDEQPQRVDDGLPETLREWILAEGLTHLKIKLNGDDLAWDVQRVAAVIASPQKPRPCAAARPGSIRWTSMRSVPMCSTCWTSCASAATSTGGLRPHSIHRTAHESRFAVTPENRMHAAAHIKPVVIDEALVDLESLLLARDMGYSGVALKACKGQSEALLMGAAAQKFGMFLCVQDLTCPGASFLHSASLAARIPTVAAIEGNGRQYCPAGNQEWQTRYPTMFQISDGTVGTAVLNGPGLGF